MNANPKKKAATTIALPYWVNEFGLIRTATLTLLGAITIATTGVLLSEVKLHEAETQLEQSQRTRDAANSVYAQVDNEKRDIRNFQQRFIELRQRGMIGDERRLDWLDAIRQTQENLKLPPLSYEIEPQQPVQLEAPLDLGEFQLRGSRMRLHMELLHELDLFNFFQDLRSRGFYAVQDCSIKRLGVVAGTPGAATLGADCTLNWITLNTAPKAPRVAALPPPKGKS
ncbi:hypothetical protein GJ699_02970 [Duganella sp. FT80W]|uniref:Uncharacterized protein n=1 Tax=Duganella guangzhouensis TaxID=2666084 RepID=A0A6I2KT28_9BURK|nr:hypothetical protein [Duganella guangzhouensis]MRW88938.1 hypothetical protein [Duganella guangzhouensis]